MEHGTAERDEVQGIMVHFFASSHSPGSPIEHGTVERDEG